MDIDPQWTAGLRAWAERNGNVAEMWLFGSRAKGTARSDSDVDLALVLMPSDGITDWGLGNYFALHKRWQAEPEVIVGRHVSLEPFPREDEELPDHVVEARASAVRLWPWAVDET